MDKQYEIRFKGFKHNLIKQARKKNKDYIDRCSFFVCINERKGRREMYSEETFKKAVIERTGIKDINEEEWGEIRKITFDDIYANCICLGKDITYEYYINIASRVLCLLRRVSIVTKINK